jgi:hypothetical protein
MKQIVGESQSLLRFVLSSNNQPDEDGAREGGVRRPLRAAAHRELVDGGDEAQQRRPDQRLREELQEGEVQRHLQRERAHATWGWLLGRRAWGAAPTATQ